MSRKLTDKTKALLAAETGTIHKDHRGRLRFALAFPNTYKIGMSTLGMQIVYRLINSHPHALAERVFLPDSEDVTEHRRTGTRLFTVESQTAVRDFDVLAFSVSFEMDYVHVIDMLRLAGIPTRAADRDETYPLVIAGGPAVTFNPEPLAEAFDAVIIGEAEDVVPEIIEALMDQSVEKAEMLEKLCRLDGGYVPGMYLPDYGEDGTVREVKVIGSAPEKITRRLTRDVDGFNGSSVILTPNCEFPNMLLTEVIRGCSRQCRFCVAGYTTLPPRPRKVNLNEDPGARAGLVGSAVFDHPEAETICCGLVEQGREFSVSSIRIETLSPELAKMMYQAGQRTMTIAPEAGSERLRRAINKSLTDEQVYDAVRKGYEAGFDRVKLYYMIGLPGEGDEDIEDIIHLARSLNHQFPGVHFQFSTSCYVPKPWTPFQWCAMEDQKVLTSRMQRLKRGLAGVRHVQFSGESPRLALVQALLARGDRRLFEFLEAAADEGGSYNRAVAGTGIDVSFYVNRRRSEDEVFPWDHLDLRVSRKYLLSELHKAFDHKCTPACRVGVCHRCGVC